MRMRVRYDPRHVVWRACGSHTSGERSRPARSAGRRQSRGCGSGEGRRHLRCFAGAAAVQVPTLKAADDAKVPTMPAGTRVKGTRTDSRAAPATLPDVSVQRLAHGPLRRSDADASTTGAFNSVARSSRRTRRSRWARTPGHPARDVYGRFASRTPRPYFAAVTTATLVSTVSRTALAAYGALRRCL